MSRVVTPKNCDTSVKKAIQQLASQLAATSSPAFAGLTLSKICTTAAGLNVLRVTGLQTDDTALTGTLRGAYIDVSNGSLDATGTIRALELKARTEAPGDTGNDVAVLEGLSISADSKAHSVTTMRAAEFILDGKTAGTIDEAVGLRIANNLQVDKATLSYGLQIYRDSFDYTYDISLSLGGHITGDSYINQDLRITASPTFAGLHINSADVDSTTLLTLESDINNNNEYNEILFKVVGGQNYGAIRSCVGAIGGDSYMSFFTTTNGGTLVRQVTIQHNGKVGFGTYNPETLLTIVSAAPYLTLYNITEEDTDGGGESRLIYKREDGAGTGTACFQFEASHDGSGANDRLGKGIWSVNTGAGLTQALEIGSDLLATFAGAITASNYTAANLLTACATNAGALDFSAANKTLTVEDDAIVSQDYSSDASPQFTGIELGHTTDTTITRVSAGVIAVEGTTVMLVGGAPTAHSIASHNDTTGTGAELNTLTGGGDVGALHTHAAAYQPLDVVLTDLAALTAVANNEFIVGDGAGSYAHESGATARTSLGVDAAGTASGLVGTHEATYNHGNYNTAYSHSQEASGNPHSVTPTELSLVIGTNTQAWDAGLDALAALGYVSDSMIKITAEDTYEIRTLAQVLSDIGGQASGNYITALTGEVTASGPGSVAATIAANAVTYAKIQNVSATNKVLGRATAGAGVVEEIACTAAGRTILAGVDAAAQKTTLSLNLVENTALSTWAGTTNITTLGTITTVGNITIANGGTIGCTGAPVLTFDDTNDYLEITGCNVGINEVAPNAKLHVSSTVYGVPSLSVDTNTSQLFESGAQGAFAFGQYGASPYAMWMQAKAENAVQTYPLSINPLGGLVSIGGGTAYTQLTVEGALTLKEQANADGDTVAYGQIWVRSDAPNVLMFTNDVGDDFTIDVTAVV